MVSTAPFTELDFDQYKTNLRNYLQSQSRFRDYDFTGSNLNVLLDVLSYNTYHNNIYRNMVFSELFLDSTQKRENAMSHAKELNYLPSSVQSSQATLDISINVSDLNSPNTITIPKGTRFVSVQGSRTFNFTTDRNRTVRKINNQYRVTNLQIFEGRILRQFYPVNNSEPQEYIISNENVDASSITVFVHENESDNASRQDYIRKDDIFGVEADDFVFYVEPHFDNLYKISFGRDRFGREPINGEVIEIEYRISSGEEANGARNWNAVANNSIVVLNSNTRSRNGSPRESIDSIKFFAPKSIQIQERAVTVSDYEILLKQKFPDIQAISVYGGDEADPPQYGKVIISVDVFGTEGTGTSEISEYRNYLRDKTPLTIEPIFVAPDFLFVDLDVRVNYDPRQTAKNSDEIEQLVKNTIITFSDENLNRFNSILRQSRLSAAIDSSETSILSTDITSNPFVEYIPDLRTVQNPIFEFNDSLIIPYPLNETSGFTAFKPSIQSTKFVVDRGDVITIQDDGNGNMIIITASSSNRRILNSNIGTVDYSRGIVRLINIVINRFDGAAIKIIANTANKDVRSSKNKILVIREQDINVEMVASR